MLGHRVSVAYCYRLHVWVALARYVHLVFFFKQKTAYEMRISDWSSDVCSSDLANAVATVNAIRAALPGFSHLMPADVEIHRSEERRVGKECVSTCRSRWSPHP